MLELLVWREKNLRRETRVVGILSFIHTSVFRTLFGKPADSLERSNEREDECAQPRRARRLHTQPAPALLMRVRARE